jgi:hemerythrin-like domain-containing protein
MSSTLKIADLIHREHIKTMQALQGLDGLLRKNNERLPPNLGDAALRTLMDSIVRMLAEDIQCHFGFEENHLFPELAARGQGDITAFLTEEHGAIRPLAQAVADLATAALQGTGFSSETWKSFYRQGSELCEREFFHIQKEEMGLLAAISMLIDDEADFILAKIYSDMIANLAV